jgi:hypothetical protein
VFALGYGACYAGEKGFVARSRLPCLAGCRCEILDLLLGNLVKCTIDCVIHKNSVY